MSLFIEKNLHYAETHFKFKLPWSLLYRPWPEIIVDAPFQFVPHVKPFLWIVVRDADRFPVTIQSLEIEIKKVSDNLIENLKIKSKKNQKTEIHKFENLKFYAKKSFEFFPIELKFLESGVYEIIPTIVATKGNKKRIFKRWNLTGLKEAPLKIQILQNAIPKPIGYVSGEMHCHTYFSKDHVEYGASPQVMQQSAKAVGLDFVNFTDHAYDFHFLNEDYTKEAVSPVARFQELKDEIEKLKRSPLLIASEEISVGNSKGENVHLITLDSKNHLPGLGDCGRYWLHNTPTCSIQKILKLCDSPCFAAHPKQPMGILEKFIFRRGYWGSVDLHTNENKCIRGIQFWNGARDEGFEFGKNFWIEELGKGHFLLPIGGNDAHGDLNDTTFVKMPLISLGHSRNHIFGKVRTVVKISDAVSKEDSTENIVLTKEALKKSFAEDNVYVTDGPALWWEREGDYILFHAQSNSDLGGGFLYVRIFGRSLLPNGGFALKEKILPESLVATADFVTIKVSINNMAYLRAECETASKRFALTSAVRNSHLIT